MGKKIYPTDIPSPTVLEEPVDSFADLKPGTLYAFTLKAAKNGYILPEGRRQICKIVKAYTGYDPKPVLLGRDRPREDWESWNVTSNRQQIRGKYPKRVSRLLLHQVGTPLSNEALTEIGNVASKFRIKEQTHLFDLDDNIEWEPGDFGDSGSCFWGSNKGAIGILKAIGGLGLRVFENVDRHRDVTYNLYGHHPSLCRCRVGRISSECKDWRAAQAEKVRRLDSSLYDGEVYSVSFNEHQRWYEGAARAWVVETSDGVMLFNGYGLPTVEMARLLAGVLGGEYVEVNMTYSGNSLLYMNSDTGYQIVRGGQPKYRHYDLESGPPEPSWMCSHCNEPQYYGDEMYQVHETYGDGPNHLYIREHSVVCQRCIKTFKSCTHCTQRFYDRGHSMDKVYRHNEHDYQWWCKRCIEHNMTGRVKYCESCNRLYNQVASDQKKNREFVSPNRCVKCGDA